MTRLAEYLAELGEATEVAAAAETAYRADYARRVEALARERAFAFRRANLLRAVAEAVAAAEDDETAVAHGLATLRGRLGWASDGAARDEIVARFAPVCAALRACCPGQEGAEDQPDPAAALAVFEAWYLEARGTPFWTLFETYMPETPVVDF